MLFWGILVALVLRMVFILTGAALFHHFHWIIYLFGTLLIYTGIKMLLYNSNTEKDLSKNTAVKLCRKFLPVTEEYHGNQFLVKVNKKKFFTPLFLVLMVINITDILFAIDSIPAVLAISNDAFIVYTSNIFAILGLRSIYFLLSGLMHLFNYLKYGLAFILSFIGVKMLISSWYEIPITLTLAVVLGILAISIILSIIFKPKKG